MFELQHPLIDEHVLNYEAYWCCDLGIPVSNERPTFARSPKIV